MENTILLVDDHPVFRRGLYHLLEKEKDLRVVGEADDGHMAVELVRRKRPDLVIMDINMPNLDGIEATRQILSEVPETRVVALSVNSGRQFIRSMIQAGATGYILKESIPEEMIEGIRAVLSGNVYLSKSISNLLVSDYRTLVSETRPEPDGASETILYTKLHRPPISAAMIPRARLIQILENGVYNPMTLIAAPAGYGKSILASQWIEISELPAAWVSLDENDNDLRVFLVYIIEAIQTMFSDGKFKTKSLLSAANLPPPAVIARCLLNDLENISQRFILVVDDYHHIHNHRIHEFLTELLIHPSPNLHLALLTRRDPPLPLTHFRARGILTEITLADIRFSVAETRSFLERFLRIAITEQTAVVLEEKIEGWVTGLHLAALSIKNEADQKRLTAGLLGTAQYVRDYLIQEVLSQVPQRYNRYLLSTAILDRFCAPLCDALSPVEPERYQAEVNASGRDFIDWLIKANLFTIPLDTASRWFRYHHLFQDLLKHQRQQRFSAEENAANHLRAGEWFAAHGFIDEAVKHDIAAGNIIGAAQLVEQNRLAVIGSDKKLYFLEKWLPVFPETIVRERPGLLMAQVWLDYFHYRFKRIRPMIDAVESLLNDASEEDPLYGEVYLFKGVFCFMQGDGLHSLRYLEDAMKRIPESLSVIRGFAEAYFGLASQMQGQKDRAVTVMSDLLDDASLAVSRKARVLVSLVWIHIISGELTVASRLNKQFRDIAMDGGMADFITWASYNQGIIHFCRNELDEAIHHLGQASKLGHLVLRRASTDCMAGLSLAYQATRQTEKADAALESLFEYIRPFNDPALFEVADSCRKRLALMKGETGTKPVMMDQTQTPDAAAMVFWLEVPVITRCRAALAEKSPADLQAVEGELKEYQRINQAHHNTCQMIGILVLQALAIYRQGRLEASLKVLKKAVAMAGPGGVIRPFIELGPPMAELLNQLREKSAAGNFIEALLAAFPDDEPEAVPEAADFLPPVEPALKSQPLIEPLTHRELDVLELLSQRFRNKEIAEKLFISPETVKGHLKNIYQKLDVSDRRRAVLKARKLRIFPRS